MSIGSSNRFADESSGPDGFTEIPELSEGGRGSDDLERIPFWVRALWFIFGALGFVDTIYTSDKSAFPWHPVASLNALAWLCFTIVALIVNSLEQVGLPGAKLSFRKRLRQVTEAADLSQKSVAALTEVIDDYAGLLQSWTNAVNLLPEHLERYGVDVEKAYDILARFCLERMEEARDIIGESGERLRFSFWWFDEDSEGLKLLFSDDIRDEATLAHVFQPGSGLMGQCFIEDRVYNLEDAPTSIYYEKIRESPDYYGLLLVPVRARTGGEVIGVLSIDRQKKETFAATAENVARALGDLIAYAIHCVLTFQPPKAKAGSESPTQ
jgi:hypothetical protein